MYSVTSSDRRERCGHDEHYEGCLSCHAHDVKCELEEAIMQETKVKGVINDSTEHLAESWMPKHDRARFQAKLERATKQLESWKERVYSLREMAYSKKKDMESLCAGVDPSQLPATFERHADYRAEEHCEIWRSRAPTVGDSMFIEFRQETPNRPGSFKGLDRSKIEATPDCLVKDGVGLQRFLKAGMIFDEDNKITGYRLPTQTIGDQTGRAFMSYGAALDIFGLPDAPGGDPDSDDKAEAESSLEGVMARIAIEEPVEPVTEREFRILSDSYQQTEPLMSEAEQWAMFQSQKFIADADVLARQYVKLVAGKEQAAASSGPWPSVEGLDWAGFTNWVKRCKGLDPKLHRVTRDWAKQRHGRRVLIKKLEQWKAPADFDDGSRRHPDPRDYWRHEDKSLGFIDMKQMGMNPQTIRESGKHPQV